MIDPSAASEMERVDREDEEMADLVIYSLGKGRFAIWKDRDFISDREKVLTGDEILTRLRGKGGAQRVLWVNPEDCSPEALMKASEKVAQAAEKFLGNIRPDNGSGKTSDDLGILADRLRSFRRLQKIARSRLTPAP